MKQRHHKGRATVEYAGIKRANWSAIMRKSLGPYLGRPISDEEIAALITVWRFDGKSGMAPIADRTMREAFARFRRDHHDPELRRRVRRRTARQWLEGARFFANAGRCAEAMRYTLRAALWSLATVIEAARGRW
jgi:hypothetical protein